MAGDVGGALILLVSVWTSRRPACTRTAGPFEQEQNPSPRQDSAESNETHGHSEHSFWSCVLQLPFSMVWMAALNALCYIAFLSSTVEVAVCGQVFMGECCF
jgi:hypothetical protein